MTRSTSPALGAAFASLAERIRDGRTPTEVYQEIADSATAVIGGCDHASVMLEEQGRFRTVAASDDIARQIDELERQTGQGPCLDAIQGKEVTHDPDLSVDPTWPQLAARVLAETPVRGVLAFRLGGDPRKTGALNVFSTRPNALDATAVNQALVLASFASVAVTAASERSRADNLKVALDSNREIGKALGMMMAAHNLTEAQAFNVLKSASQSLNRKINDIAVEFTANSTPRPE